MDITDKTVDELAHLARLEFKGEEHLVTDVVERVLVDALRHVDMGELGHLLV